MILMKAEAKLEYFLLFCRHYTLLLTLKDVKILSSAYSLWTDGNLKYFVMTFKATSPSPSLPQLLYLPPPHTILITQINKSNLKWALKNLYTGCSGQIMFFHYQLQSSPTYRG